MTPLDWWPSWPSRSFGLNVVYNPFDVRGKVIFEFLAMSLDQIFVSLSERFIRVHDLNGSFKTEAEPVWL